MNAAVESERFDYALELVKSVPTSGCVSPTWKARHSLDVAIAHSELDQDKAATAQLLAAEQIAPEWMQYHTLIRPDGAGTGRTGSAEADAAVAVG